MLENPTQNADQRRKAKQIEKKEEQAVKKRKPAQKLSKRGTPTGVYTY